MAAADALGGQPEALEGAVDGDGLNRIMAAGGSVAARRRKHRRDASLVEPNRQYQQACQQLLHHSGYYISL